MFDPEKLLSKVVKEVVGKKKGKKKGKKNKKSSLTDHLTSGAGLLTIVGLGVGAYEILKSQKSQSGPYGGQPAGTYAPPPPSGSRPTSSSATPPPIPGADRSVPAQPAPEPTGVVAVETISGDLSREELSCRMIQVMVAAAHADGTMDTEEEKAILDRLRGAELSQEERMFLLDELHQPKSIEAITAGITDPGVAKTMYMLAVATIDIDTETERTWLDNLAGQLGLSAELQSFIDGE